MDVRVSKLEASPEVKTTAQKQIYHDIIAAALSEQAFDGLYLWGFSDRHVSDNPDIFIKSINHKNSYHFDFQFSNILVDMG